MKVYLNNGFFIVILLQLLTQEAFAVRSCWPSPCFESSSYEAIMEKAERQECDVSIAEGVIDNVNYLFTRENPVKHTLLYFRYK